MGVRDSPWQRGAGRLKWHRIPKFFSCNKEQLLRDEGGVSRLDDLILYSVTYDLADGMQLEFSHDIGSMSFGCLNADSESNRHFLTAFPFS
jgi:hypothetical protein